jgi:hypothetical protein
VRERSVIVAQLTHAEYDALERAVTEGQRIAIYRRGTEFVVVPRRLRLDRGREAIDSVHPTTGDEITFYVDEVETIEVVK